MFKLKLKVFLLFILMISNISYALECGKGPRGNMLSTWYIPKGNEQILLSSLKEPKSIFLQRVDLNPGSNTNNYGVYINVDGQPIKGPEQPNLHHLGGYLSEAKSIELLSSSTLNTGDSMAGLHSFSTDVNWDDYIGFPWNFEAGDKSNGPRSAPVFKGNESRHIRICFNQITPHPQPIEAAKFKIYTDTGYLRLPSISQGDNIARFTLLSCVDVEAKEVIISADKPSTLKQKHTFEGCAYIERR